MKKRICMALMVLISGIMVSATINTTDRPSELAKLMKQMLGYIQNEKQLIAENKPASRLNVDAHVMNKAKITKGKKLSENHKEYMSNFFDALEKYHQAKDSSERKISFNTMVNSCIKCHQHECPGPITAIKKNLFDN